MYVKLLQIGENGRMAVVARQDACRSSLAVGLKMLVRHASVGSFGCDVVGCKS